MVNTLEDLNSGPNTRHFSENAGLFNIYNILSCIEKSSTTSQCWCLETVCGDNNPNCENESDTCSELDELTDSDSDSEPEEHFKVTEKVEIVKVPIQTT